MEINRYIKDLLLEHDCVVIPGLGGFIGSSSRAELQSITKTITPPGKRISFNAQLQRNDGLLIHHVAYVEGVSYDEAEHGVQEFVKACKRRLEQSGLIIFQEVGKLTMDADGIISFYPTPGRNLLQESFGLKPVHYRQTFDTVTQPNTVETAPVNTPLQPVGAQQNKTKKLFSTYGVSIAAMLAIVIFVAQGVYFEPLALENFGFFKPESIFKSSTEAPKTDMASINAEPIAAGSLEATGTLEVVENNVTEEITTPVIEETTTPTPEPVNHADAPVHITEISTNDVEDGYYIILGAYSSKRNANNFIKEHNNLSGLVIIPSNGLLRVALPAGSVATEAYQLLEKQRQQENAAAWLVYNNR